MSFPPIIDRDEATSRMARIFPRTAFDNTLNGTLAGAAVAAMVYVGAVVGDDDELTADTRFVRPSSCLWMQDDVLAHHTDDEREQWFQAATAGNLAKKKVEAVANDWGFAFRQWYADNSRETLRDETFAGMARWGAVRRRAGLPTTSSAPRWVLNSAFVELFGPQLTGEALDDGIEAWRAAHLTPGALLKVRTQSKRATAEHAVTVTLPSGDVRSLEAGDASRILKGVVEEWAPARLGDPVVLTISEPGAKIATIDASEIVALGIAINVSDVLPDALIADVSTTPVTYWVIEAVASDGPVTEGRRADLEQWADDQHIPRGDLRYVSAFISRGHPAARKRLRDLAAGTYAWFLDEPGMELAWQEIDPPT